MSSRVKNPDRRVSKRSTYAQLQARRAEVKRYYFAQKWTAKEIAKALNFSQRQIERDIRLIRQEFEQARRRHDDSFQRIVGEIIYRNDERLRLLWNEYVKLEHEEAALRRAAEERSQRLGGKPARIEGTAARRRQKLSLLREIRKCDLSLVENLRRLGVDLSGGGVAEDEILLSIKARHKKLNAVGGAADVGDGEA